MVPTLSRPCGDVAAATILLAPAPAPQSSPGYTTPAAGLRTCLACLRHEGTPMCTRKHVGRHDSRRRSSRSSCTARRGGKDVDGTHLSARALAEGSSPLAGCRLKWVMKPFSTPSLVFQRSDLPRLQRRDCDHLELAHRARVSLCSRGSQHAARLFYQHVDGNPFEQKVCGVWGSSVGQKSAIRTSGSHVAHGRGLTRPSRGARVRSHPAASLASSQSRLRTRRAWASLATRAGSS